MGALGFTRRAREDLLDIWAYVATNASEAVADRILDRLEERCRDLTSHPQSGPVRPDIAEGARMLVIERWLILYRLVDGGAQIVRVVDGARELKGIGWPSQ